MDCIFCKIISGEIPSYKIYEDDSVLAFLDISKDALGHTLVVPKKHFENILSCQNKELEKVFAVVKKISKHYIKNCNFDGVQILNNCGEVAGQSVMHFHIHIIPRKANDKVETLCLKQNFEMDLEKICQKLKLK